MRIKEFERGRMLIDGDEQTEDVILTRDEVHSGWDRQEEAVLQLDDLQPVLQAQPSILVVGTGPAGDLRLQPGLEEALKSHGITVLAMPTTLAVQRYNDLKDSDRDVAGAFRI